ncbi:MAG: 4Fe-4S dicluster domain-containing protein [Candidatus Bostrichicola ureolyticus]|nr:MAG: 4Fe-4S dicluster domain-containing protein [Candidatus Bostrichicola ureolyticus]
MALKITNECINCGACEPECPNKAIYEVGTVWKLSDGTSLKGMVQFKSLLIDADAVQVPKSNKVYFIVTDKCTECIGFNNEPQCASVCPVDCCILDINNIESKDELLKKKKMLHNEK